MISTGFNESHFEFRVNQELYGFFGVIIGFIIQKNMGLETKNLVFIYSRCWVMCENKISLHWRPFWKWRHVGSPSQFGAGGIHFLFWDKSKWQNKAIRDGRPRPPRHQGFIAISYGGSELRHRSILETITHRAKCRYYIPLHFDTNPESLRPFVPEIWPNNVFNLSATYDLDLWPKILKIFVSHGVPIRNMYAKFHNDRLRNGWDITLWNFAKTRTNKQTHTQTQKQTDMGITIPRPPPMGGEVIT